MEKIKISNFRKIKDTWELDLAPITFFTGKNNSGKSSVLKALMVLSDYTNSTNHFELDFLGDNSGNHKIENYSNCINWKNNTKSNISFEFERHGHLFSLVFSPRLIAKQENFQRGILESLAIINRQDDSKIEFNRQGGHSYGMSFNNRFLNRKNYSNASIENKKLIEAKRRIEKKIGETESEIKNKLGLQLDSSIKTTSLMTLLRTPFPMIGSTLAAGVGLSTFQKIKDLDLKSRVTLSTELEKLVSDLKLLDKKLRDTGSETIKDAEEVIFSPSFELDKLSQNDLNLNNIFNRILLPYFRNSKINVGKIDVKDETIKLSSFSDELMDLFQFDIDHLSPHRYNQERLILNKESSDDISKLAKEEIKKEIKKGSDADMFIIKWMDEFDIGTNYEIISIYGQASIINVFEKGIKKPINIADKGFGAGQIFTILLKIAQKINEKKVILKKNFYFPQISDANQVVIIEEPEANLHPALQSKLTDLFLDTYTRFGVRFVIETHSEYMLRQSQNCVKGLIEKQKCDVKNIPFGVYYFDENKGPYKMQYDEEGKFIEDFGSGFFDVSRKLTRKLL
ncbi:AAA family ATPase [Winogradskyella sp. Asnod2-B02-A]|uniref:AAA family ATPase n=1 Tax=Winogradskyella sp. Asnod2-B02-A TaxID=3160583 RepID=UPI00386B3A24